MTRVRSKNLGDAEIAAIVAILDGWSGKLTWEGLIEAVERRRMGRYTRQALYNHARIRQAFALRKETLARQADSSTPAPASPELAAALQRVARLEAENTRLAAENQRLLEQFVCWAYNAHTRGLDEAFLSRPLPPVHRQQTKRKQGAR